MYTSITDKQFLRYETIFINSTFDYVISEIKLLLQDVRRKWTYACGNSNQTSSSTLNYVILVLYCYSQPDELIQILFVREVSSVDIHLRHYTIKGFHLYPENLFIPSLYYSPFLKLEMVYVLILYNMQNNTFVAMS